MSAKIPRDGSNDYTGAMIGKRQAFIREVTGFPLDHARNYSFDPELVRGNIENFVGVAQVPVGIAGPLLVRGEYAEGEFYVPLATSEGTLVASYNRGMKLLHESGGIRTTISDDAMQRAPVFVFDSAREARDFGHWIRDHFHEIKEAAEATTHTGHLQKIEQYPASKMMFLRFNFTTGDAAGQNMVGRATWAACRWIREHNRSIRRHVLSGNIDTDKKYSHLNTLHTRGKRVTAEAVIPRHLLEESMGVPVETAWNMRNVSNLGSFMAGSNNNGTHSANAIAAVFVATGQDTANLAESSSAMVYTELTPDKDYYYSITIPSLIVATHGGGTGLATQREYLEMMGCYGKDKVNKLAEIIAATVLCGEFSLAAAIVTDEWVTSHERLGRNR